MENMSLYDISSEMSTLLENGFTVDFVDEETGEIDDRKVAERLDGLQMAFDDKVDNIACYIKSLSKLADDIKEERQSQYERETRIRKRIDYLKDYLCACFEALGKKKVETSRNEVSLSHSARTIIDQTMLPDEWWRIKTTREPDTMNIKTALKNGEEILGAALLTESSIRIKGEKRKGGEDK